MRALGNGQLAFRCSFSTHHDLSSSLQSMGIPLLPTFWLAWQGALTAPVAFANPFPVCLPFPFPPLAQKFHPKGGDSGDGHIYQYQQGWISQNQGGQVGERSVLLAACDSGEICYSVLFFFTLAAKTLQSPQAL